MGRRKIQILPITDDRNRNVTFGKRRNGLFKKAYELGVLCSADVAVLVWGHNGKLYAFSSQGQLKNMVDRYHSQRADEIDLTGPAHYGDVNDPAMRAALNMSGLMGSTSSGHAGTSASGVKGGKGSHKKRRRSEDDSDEDEDEEGDEEDAHDMSQNQNHLSSSAPTGYPAHDPHMYANGSSMSSHDNNQYNPPPHMAHHHPQQQQHPSLSGPSHSMPPYFGGPAYPYPGYPHHMPNVNPALAAGGPASNPLNFYGPTAAAIAAAAAATGSYNYGGLPPHLLRAAAQQYAQELQQQQNGNNGNGTPQSGSSTGQYVGNNNNNNNNNNNGYAPMRTSPVPMDPSAHHAPDPSASSYAHQHHSQQQRHNSGHSPGQSSRNKPNLHLSLSGQQQQQQHGSTGQPARQDSTSSNMHLGQSTQQQYDSQQSQDDMQMRRDSYSLPNGNNNDAGGSTSNNANNGNNNTSSHSNNDSLGLPAGLQFPDSYITSPSQLFPEIYRSMNAYAEVQAGGVGGGRGLAAFGGEDTPTHEDGNINNNNHNDDGDARTASAEAIRNVFRWPTMGNGNSSSGGDNGTTSSSSTIGGAKNGANDGNLVVANVKREGDEGDGSGMDR